MLARAAASGRKDSAPESGEQQGFSTGLPALSPFYLQPQQMPQLATTAGGQTAALQTVASGAASIDPAYFQSAYLSNASSGGSSSLPGSYSLSLQEQQALASGQLPTLGGQAVTYVEVGQAGGLPIIQPQFAAPPPTTMALQQQQAQQQQPPSAQPTGGQQRGGAAARAAKPRPKRPYKPPAQVAQERKLKDEANEYIRRLEQQLGKARSELERLQRDNKTLQRKAVVLSKHSSFRRCAAGMLAELQQSMILGGQIQSMGSSQRVLDAAEKGLPEPQVLEVLRKMTRDEAVQHYNSVLSKARHLLQQLDLGPDPASSQQQLDDIFTLRDKGSTFGYLQVVNPPVYAELMQAKLDPDSPVDRADPTHWRAVLAAMALSEEQESQLILLLQSYLKQAEQIVQRKSQVMQQLADELSQDLLSLELSQEGSSDYSELVSEEDSSAAAGEGVAGNGNGAPDADSSGDGGGSSVQRQISGSPKAQQAKDELDRLVRLEYWLRFDFTGCVRKLLPAQQQALCMVHSWPFYPDYRQLEAAIREKAGPLWDQLARSSA